MEVSIAVIKIMALTMLDKINRTIKAVHNCEYLLEPDVVNYLLNTLVLEAEVCQDVAHEVYTFQDYWRHSVRALHKYAYNEELKPEFNIHDEKRVLKGAIGFIQADVKDTLNFLIELDNT